MGAGVELGPEGEPVSSDGSLYRPGGLSAPTPRAPSAAAEEAQGFSGSREPDQSRPHSRKEKRRD